MPEASKEDLVASLISECDHQAEHPPSVKGVPDKYISMFATALKGSLEEFELLEESRELLSWVVDQKRSKGPFPPSYIFNHIMRSVQMGSMRDPNNPDEDNMAFPYETQEEWSERVYSVVSDRDAFRRIVSFMMIWNVGSDVETRAAGPKLVAHTMQKDRVNNPDDPFTLLNIGSARDHTLAMLRSNVEFPEVSVDGTELGVEQQKFLQKIVNKLLAKDIGLGDSYGVDMWPLRDPAWSEYLESCRFYPSELHDPIKRAIYRYLESLRDEALKDDAVSKIHHIDADYGTEKFNFRDKYEMVDMAAALTSYYQNHRKKQRAIFDASLQDVKEGGKIVIQDFCYLDEDVRSKHPIDRLKFLGPTSKPYTYGTFVYDTLKPELGIQPFAYWNNGRCEIIRPAQLLIDHIMASKNG